MNKKKDHFTDKSCGISLVWYLGKVFSCFYDQKETQ